MACASGPTSQNIPTILRKNSKGRVHIEVLDENGCPADAAGLVLTVLDGADQSIYQEDFFAPVWPPNTHRIVKPTGTTGTYYIEWGDIAFPAQAIGVGGTYPTGFVGGERLRIQIDNEVQNVVFQATDQTLADVTARLNNVFGPLLGQPVAFDSGGQLRITAKKTGRWSFVAILTPGTDPAVGTALGFSVPTIIIGTERSGETDSTATWLFDWEAADGAHPSEAKHAIQVVYVLPGAIYQMIPILRLELDKVLKGVDPKNGCNLGYTDTQLIMFVLGGLSVINNYQPYPTFSPDTYPYGLFGGLLVEAAMFWGLQSQLMYAIDTDVSSYSDQGASFVIDHKGPISQFLNTISARLDRDVPQMKLHMVRSGMSITEVGPNFRLNQIIQAAPSGATFRGLYTRS